MMTSALFPLVLVLSLSAIARALPPGWGAEETDAKVLLDFMNTFSNGMDVLGANWTGDDPCKEGAIWLGVQCQPGQGANMVDRVFSM